MDFYSIIHKDTGKNFGECTTFEEAEALLAQVSARYGIPLECFWITTGDS